MIDYNVNLSAPVRQIKAVATAYNAGAALPFPYNGDLISFQIDRIGDNRFYGYGISQKANIKIRDIARKYSFSTSTKFVITFDDLQTLPAFYVTEVNRDENTNELSVTAYDALDKASAHTVSEITLTSYTIGEFAAACASLLGLDGIVTSGDNFNLVYIEGANFDGAESLRDALNDVAEVTQTIYFVSADNKLVFKQLDKDGAAAFTISKDLYIELDSKTNRRLAAVSSVTELGDNLTASLDASGTTYFIRDNAFLDLREDRAQLVDNMLAAMGGLTINQFNCDWRGNYLLELGDKIALIAKDNDTVESYLLNDTIKYDGSFSQSSYWEYEAQEETESNATSLGEVIKQTYAKVDKVNKEINLVVNETSINSSEVAAMKLNTESISLSVASLETKVNDTVESVNDAITEINKKVSATMTDEEIEILVENKMVDSVTSVETTTGFTLNEEGLNISKSNSAITTTITENGMTVRNDRDDVLTANNDGVVAVDLHAKTFLVIGGYSRLQDIPEQKRTGCFWIGG